MNAPTDSRNGNLTDLMDYERVIFGYLFNGEKII